MGIFPIFSCNSIPVPINWYQSSNLGAVGNCFVNMMPRFDGSGNSYWWLIKLDEHFRAIGVREEEKVSWVVMFALT